MLTNKNSQQADCNGGGQALRLAWRNKIEFWTTALQVNIALDKLCVLFRAAQLSKEVKKTALEK